MAEKVGQPNALPPYAWMLPQRAGGLASINRLTGAGVATGAGTLGKRATAGLTGGLADALVATGMMASLSVGSASGVGAVHGADGMGTPSVLGYWRDATAAMTGSAILAASGVGSAGRITSSLSGSGYASLAPYAHGWVEADITPFVDLSPTNLATAVWSAMAAGSNGTGTMGEKLNDAGSASNPWTEVLEGTYTAAELLRVIAAALAGQVSGAGGATITILGVDGVTDRIVATVTPDGNRTQVALDGA
jgi:hypothetical protein